MTVRIISDFCFQVCGSVRSEPCTPLQCEAGALCPPEGTPPCKTGEKCVGALPLSNKANADVNNVKDRLDKLSVKMTDAAEMVNSYSLLMTLCYMSTYIFAEYLHAWYVIGGSCGGKGNHPLTGELVV